MESESKLVQRNEVGPAEPQPAQPTRSVDVTLVVPVTDDDSEFAEVIEAFGRELDGLGRSWECVLVFDGIKGPSYQRGLALQEGSNGRIGAIALHRAFGESVCLSSAFENSHGALLLTLPQYVQIDPRAIGRLLDAIDAGADMVTTRRQPRVDPRINQLQSWLFNWIVRHVTGANFRDLNSSTRLIRREVLEQMTIYGSMYRYLPATAYRQGFRVEEISVRHLSERGGASVFGPGVYMRRTLDVVGLMFLSRFTHKPLRFFGALGGSAILVGSLLVAIQLLQWALNAEAYGLYQRPTFLFGILFIVLGSQTIGFGLVGEIIIYTQARNLREYRIERVYE